MNTLYYAIIQPFVEFGFMRRALAGCLALALGSGPIGLLLVMRRMSLLGDAMSHAILPGAALGFVISGLSVFAMSIGGMIAGITVALLAGVATHFTSVREDASFAAFYLFSLALGVIIVSNYGTQVDLMHLLFGSVLAVDTVALLFIACIASLTLVILAIVYRPLLIGSLDPVFLRVVGSPGKFWHLVFLVLVVLNLVSGFQALGTLMSVGLMMLPAISARLWSDSMGKMLLIVVAVAFICGLGGLLLSYHCELPSGPAIILLAGLFYLISLFIAPQGGMLPRYFRTRHLAH